MDGLQVDVGRRVEAVVRLDGRVILTLHGDGEVVDDGYLAELLDEVRRVVRRRHQAPMRLVR